MQRLVGAHSTHLGAMPQNAGQWKSGRQTRKIDKHRWPADNFRREDPTGA